MPVLPDDKKKLLLSFGVRLESLIYQRYRSKDRFLAASGFYKANLHGIITGKSDPQLSTLYRLAKALDLTLSELVQVLDVDMDEGTAIEGTPAPSTPSLVVPDTPTPSSGH